MAESRSQPQAFARDLFDGLPHRYDRLEELLSFGQNRRWRDAMVRAVATARPAPRRVLDVASGTAGVALLLARRTAADITGVDLTPQMLAEGQRQVRARGQSGRIRLVCGNACDLPFGDETFDALTFTYLLRYVDDPAATLRELARVVRPGGAVASLEFGVPGRLVPRAAWRAYTRAGLPLGGLVLGGPEWWSVGRFLGPSIEAHYRAYPVDWTVSAWSAAGLAGVRARPMSFGGGLVMWGRKRAS
ncbi:MAG TPA: class I SAM-dependent methyltransferase [Nocardioidaceae bacterium]|nr:class I SAM-dependent methyltransferase [Nocardioidaceae bacterium]